MNVNISGNYSLTQLKTLRMRSRTGTKYKGDHPCRYDRGLDREVQIDVDMNAMKAAQITLGDIERAINFEKHEYLRRSG